MRKEFMYAVFFAVLLAAVVKGAGSGEIVDSYKIKVTMLSQDPDPVEPGRFTDLRFKFENYGLREAPNVEVELLPEKPFSLYTGSAVQSIGTLTGRQTGVDGAIVKYRVRVDSDAVEGANEIEIRYRIDNGPWVTLEPFEVNVERHEAILSVKSARLSPSPAEPGQEIRLDLSLENIATGLLKDVKVELGLITVLKSTTAITTKELPFSPLDSANQKVIESIGPGKETSVGFNLIVDPDADTGVYKVPVSLSYSDEKGANYSSTVYTSVVVSAKPDVSVMLDSTDLMEPGNKGSVTLRVVNKGLAEVKFVTVEVLPDEGFDLLSGPVYYMGNIDSDDYETASFDLYAKKCADCDLSLPVKLTYKDSSNKDYSETANIRVPLYSESEIEMLGFRKKNPLVGIAITALIVVLGLFIYRAWRKKRRK